MATVRLILRRQTAENPRSGFRVTLDARDFNRDDIEGTLPPLPESLVSHLEAWQQAYVAQEEVRSHCRIAGGAVISQSIQDINNLSEALEQDFNAWLVWADRGWVRIREVLAIIAHQTSEAPRLLLDLGNNHDLKRLPWQDWELFASHYRHADAALRLFNDARQRLPDYPFPRSARIRILVVVGDTTGINASEDLNCINQLQSSYPEQVEVVSLLQPTPAKLQSALEDPQGYHIVVYVGHSRSREDGQVGWLLLNERDELGIRDFRRAMKQAIDRGLQLIILNSCDGLGLAQQLAKLDAPRCIVMKEPVPDEVAVEFINRFFRAFVEERQSLQAAVRRSRQGLESFNSRYSEVTWLPTVFIKQNAQPLTWQTLLDHCSVPELPPPPSSHWPKLAVGAVAALALVGAIATQGYWWPSVKQLLPGGLFTISQSSVDPDKLISAGSNPSLEGSRPLSEPYAQLKRDGIQAFEDGDYEIARNKFDELRRQAIAQKDNLVNEKSSPDYRAAFEALQDPTVLIYRNNAEVRRRYQDEEQPIYTIAAAVPLSDTTGQEFNIGREMLFGIAQAQDKAVNSDTSDTSAKNLEVVIANDLNNPAQAAEVAAAIAQLDMDGRKVLAVVGHYLSESTCEGLERAYNSAGIVVISPLSTLTTLRSDCGPSNWFFRTTSSNEVEAETLVDYLISSQPEGAELTIAMFYREGEDYSEDLRTQFKLALQPEIKITQEFNLADKRFDPAEALAAVPDVDALVVIPDGRNAGSEAFDNALRVIRANAGDKIVLGSNPLYNGEIVGTPQDIDSLSNLYVATDWHPKCAPTDFVEETEEYWLGGVNRTAILPYETIQALLPTLQTGVTSGQIRQQLNSLDDSDVAPLSRVFENSKTISFDGDGDRNELTKRIITTVSQEDGPFRVVGNCP